MTADTDADDVHDDIIYPSTIPFVLVHLGCFAAIWTGVTWQALAICVTLYWLRIFAIGAGYHRYFSHRAYSTSRAFQFVLAFLSQTTTQKSVIWWASKHRHHHLHSDTGHDVHSPRHHGFIYSHLGWIFSRKHDDPDFAKVSDLTRYPELMWLHKFEHRAGDAPCRSLLSPRGLVRPRRRLPVEHGARLSRAPSASTRSLMCSGSKRYVTGDNSRNNWLLAVFTMGEGWHNNHHAYQSSVRQGFKWWEIDPTYYLLRALSWIGLVWDLKTPPEPVLRNEQRLGAKVINRAAEELAARFNSERIAAAIAAALHTPELSALQDTLTRAHHRTSEMLKTLHVPHIPTREEFRARGQGHVCADARRWMRSSTALTSFCSPRSARA